MSHLYVCHFSNGHIKVGRSSIPDARIAQHEERVSCMGVALVESQAFECVGDSVWAESNLITCCADASTAQHKNEWFEGLDFPTVCVWAMDCASLEVPVLIDPFGRNLAAIRRARELTQADLGAQVGVSKATISHWEVSRYEPNLDQLRALSKILNVRVDALIFEQPA